MMPLSDKTDTHGAASRGFLEGPGLTAVLLGGAILLTLVLYYDSVASAVYLWANRSAYNHGFVIAPIALYLVWDRRAVLAGLTPRADWAGYLVIAGFSLAWVVARSAGINEAEHFAVVGVLQGVVLAILGRKFFAAILLPMMYLWLMVPTGTALYPLLQGVAHFLSATMLKLSGIPVYAEGFFLEVPSGLYEVAKGCSGLNFILAGLALSPLFGVMMYNSLKKRIIAVVAMLAIAVLANGVRIYAIIALAEFSDRRIDIVDDHVLYGWGFFAVILVLAGYVGSRFADPVPVFGSASKAVFGVPVRRTAVIGAAVTMVVLAALPLYRMAALTAALPDEAQVIDLAALELEVVGKPARDWAPSWPYATRTRHFEGTHLGLTADYFIAGYFNPRDASEMFTSGNDLVGNAAYRFAGGQTRVVDSVSGGLPWIFVHLEGRRGEARLVVWTAQVNGVFVTSPFKAKVLQAMATLSWSRSGGGVVMLSVPVTDGFEGAEEHLMKIIAGSDFTGLFNRQGR